MTLISELEALTVGPDEVLIIRVPEDVAYADGPAGGQSPFLEGLIEALKGVGLAGRSIVLSGAVELAKVTVSEGQPVAEVALSVPVIGENTVQDPGIGRVEPGNDWVGEGAS
jgi:hypothetical protein